MTHLIAYKLLSIVLAVALGWLAGRMRWLGEPAARAGDADPARMLGNAAFYIFVPALLMRTTARLDLAALPRTTLLAFFVPAIAVTLGVYALARWQAARLPAAAGNLDEAERRAAMPAVRAFAVVFGNSVQVGIPVATALFGETGLGIHVTLVSLHALVLLTLLTVLVELDLARARSAHEASASLLRTVRITVRNAVIHPVTLPVLLGLAWNLTGWPLPVLADEVLQLLGTAVAPLCLVLIGLSLAYTRLHGALGTALGITLAKLLLMPAVVLVVAHWGFGLGGVPLAVVTMMAALPTGSNALIFAQRYRSQEAEATAASVLSTLGFAFTVPLWLAVLARL
ncbi:AEC family transporter [Aquabacterium sp. OR-4]|uniref:AEC family transporter n=1 Tax=Aquabacterium sp. OR-4 TaxID=2978127 RepID=UPI0021B44370|nr:AEC family transporter [Aquabacterium sp. OR-4]MDT7834082.1 AEC family transporter [Aquabacterium sp. OR-4]